MFCDSVTSHNRITQTDRQAVGNGVSPWSPSATELRPTPLNPRSGNKDSVLVIPLHNIALYLMGLLYHTGDVPMIGPHDRTWHHRARSRVLDSVLARALRQVTLTLVTQK